MRTNRNVTVEDKNKYALHIQSKIETKQERDNDHSMDKSASNDTAVICFNIENVIALPRSNISSFFFKRNLNLYNLTFHLSLGKNCYLQYGQKD